MTVGSLMNSTVVTVSVTATFADAYSVMTGQRVPAIPVVDANGVYLGMFDFEDVWELLLPRAAMLGMDSLKDLSFVSGATSQLAEKLKAAGPRSIREFLDAEVQPVYPETPAKEAILLFHHHNVGLPVVERGTRRLLGMITPWDVLDGLR